MMPSSGDDFIRTIVAVAERDASIARVLREICALDGSVRDSALDLVGAHLRNQAAPSDVLACVQALRRDDVARALGERLGAG
jgi:hypothetical protein